MDAIKGGIDLHWFCSRSYMGKSCGCKRLCELFTNGVSDVTAAEPTDMAVEGSLLCVDFDARPMDVSFVGKLFLFHILK